MTRIQIIYNGKRPAIAVVPFDSEAYMASLPNE